MPTISPALTVNEMSRMRLPCSAVTSSASVARTDPVRWPLTGKIVSSERPIIRSTICCSSTAAA